MACSLEKLVTQEVTVTWNRIKPIQVPYICKVLQPCKDIKKKKKKLICGTYCHHLGEFLCNHVLFSIQWHLDGCWTTTIGWSKSIIKLWTWMVVMYMIYVHLPVSALMASCMPGGLTATVSAFAVTTAVLSTTLTWQNGKKQQKHQLLN